MSEDLYLSRARLRANPAVAALRALLIPTGQSERAGAGHRLVWSLFAEAPDRPRDFLWREADAGIFYLLSRRPPQDALGLFDLDPPKIFAPELSPGDRLLFVLRANATVARGGGPGRRGKPCDVVMDALSRIPRQARPEERRRLTSEAGIDWLERQAAKSGFSLLPSSRDGKGQPANPGSVRVMGYRTLRVEHSGPMARIGILDFEGTLELREPGVFMDALGRGFGRAKAFGCGLMLIRRP